MSTTTFSAARTEAVQDRRPLVKDCAANALARSCLGLGWLPRLPEGRSPSGVTRSRNWLSGVCVWNDQNDHFYEGWQLLPSNSNPMLMLKEEDHVILCDPGHIRMFLCSR